MEENISTALKLMLIGMTTVSVILVLIVISAKALIKIVNKYSVESKNLLYALKENEEHIAAITGAVDLITGGKGIIKEIKKINNG